MSKRTVIIDAYNVIHRVPELAQHLKDSVDKAREVLIRYCIEWRDRRRDVDLFQVVFDGSPSLSGSVSTFRVRNVQVLYPAPGETADHKIARILRGSGEDADYIVVSDDNEVRAVARGHRAQLMRVNEFYGVLSKKRRARAVEDKEADDKSLSPSEIKKINEDLLREWGE